MTATKTAQKIMIRDHRGGKTLTANPNNTCKKRITPQDKFKLSNKIFRWFISFRGIMDNYGFLISAPCLLLQGPTPECFYSI